MKTIEKELKTKNVREVYKVILALKDMEECEIFFRDILTFEEIEEMARRWQVAKMLAKKIPFKDIERKTKMSSTTIARINYWLHHGTGGYKLLLKRLGLM
ncbi:MAG: YerC/YecD family TrpR-related protein [Candidatus Berkelbacteria bacterium]|nr:YerC/YecD family TrpR-related protein [Candidatus Berkelbacteria bacterium]